MASLAASEEDSFWWISAPEELYALFGLEFYDTCRMEAQPMTPIEKTGETFQRWAPESR